MDKRKVWRIIIIVVSAMALYATFVITMFYLIQNNPTDQVAALYIRENEEIQNQYGEIDLVARYVAKRSLKDGDTRKVAYSLHVASDRVIIYVTLIKNENDEWEAVSWEEIEVISDAN